MNTPIPTQPTVEEKVRFYGNHIGCSMIYVGENEDEDAKTITTLTGVCDTGYFLDQVEVAIQWVDKQDVLYLKKLSSISDEDAIEVAKMSFRDLSNQSQSEIIEIGKRLINSVTSDDASYFSGRLCIAICDLLRSKGYAIRFMQYTVDQIISFGWIKLQEA